MNENSDIRTGGRALTAATIICCLFAATATVSALRTSDAVRTHQLAVASGSTAATRKTTSVGHVAKSSGQVMPVDVVVDQFARTGIQETLAVSAGHTPITSVVSTTPIDELPASALDKRGIYVPVTVHPVTVNLDGAAFAEQMGRLADNMGEALAARPTPMPIDVAALNSVEDRIQVAMRDDRLSKIDSNLERLTTKVDSLMSESRRADASLNNELQQKVASSQLVDEFRQTLAEHRELLTRRQAEQIPRQRKRVAQGPPIEESLSDAFEDSDDVPFPVDWEDETPQIPERTGEPENEILYVPLPSADDVETSFHADEPSVIAEDWEMPVADLHQIEEAAPEPSPENESSPVSSEVSNSNSGRAFFRESSLTDPVNEVRGESKHSPTDSTPQEPSPVITVRESIKISEPDTAIDQKPTGVDEVHPETPAVEIPVAVSPEPVVFEQTVNVVMPPAANRLEDLRKSYYQQMKSTVPPIVNESRATTAVAHSDVQRQSGSSIRQSTEKRAEGIVVPDRHLNANNRLPIRNQPPRLRPVPVAKHRRKPRTNVDGALDALTDAGGMVTDSTLGLFDRVMKTSKMPRLHSRPRKALPALHRVGAAIRGVGRSPLVD